MNYAIRVSYGYDNTLEGLAGYLQTTGICSRFAIYEHPADAKVERTHIHALVMGLTVSTDTLKNKIADCLGIRPKGNKEWSFKTTYKPYNENNMTQQVNDNFITYMSKGKYEPKAFYGYEKERIDMYKGKFISKTIEAKIELVDGKFVVDDNERKSLTRRQLLSLMIGKYDDISNQKINCPERLMRKTMEMIGSVLRAQGEPFGENKVIDFYDSVLMHCEQKKWLDNACYRIQCRYRR